ncbi:nickel pincer cofactor biosynthesis protein LarC [Methanococcus voltae]|uniref:Uncharacterized protein (TIGR00299 family) protein n=2 Tax=Methanococcus voltae TaxID=2188 RepID=A0A8J7RZE7_METVO|nr:nickel pincer cofactor biosynthesis protein LarC [Methanococcus voltae]MBP2172399.1 uncharacterized protein (TIGR00299 family) protein [Methanococcus voltae]MBP2200645.1 uncharacterized protein (TIGR00299 family) protein [Methanococcus voltae]MCS3921370.1 uncharacterized protein (TIGR00299 family) protein [Methanococcus voltae PS]
MKYLLIDPKISGISGDMLINSLLDLTERYDLIEDVVSKINELENCKCISVDILNMKKLGIMSKYMEILIDEKKFGNPEMLKKCVLKVCEKLNMTDESISTCENIVDDLILAEKNIHGDNFHLHEVASLDTVLDIVGSIYILEKCEYPLNQIISTYPVLGNGYVNIDHGILPVPVPAVLEILKKHNAPFQRLQTPKNDNLEEIEVGELTTPTGIAILCNITSEFCESYPSSKILKIGYGAGTKDLKNTPNILRILEISNLDFENISEEKMALLETNVDDISGEIIGHVINKVMEEGASDVFVTPVIGKKNRPANKITIICKYAEFEKYTKLLMEETGTLGIRITEFNRYVADRKLLHMLVELNDRKFRINVKYSYINNKLVNIKPEYEDLKRISEELEIPLRKVSEIVKKQFDEKRLF